MGGDWEEGSLWSGCIVPEKNKSKVMEGIPKKI